LVWRQEPLTEGLSFSSEFQVINDKHAFVQDQAVETEYVLLSNCSVQKIG